MMITIFTTPSCSSCRKAKSWLDNHNIRYQEKNLATSPLTEADVMQMFNNSRDGFNDILSKRSKVYKEYKDQNIDFDELRFWDMIKIIMENPSILKRPIIVDDTKMKIGFHEDEISIFVPIELRNQILEAKKGDAIIKSYTPKKYHSKACEDCGENEITKTKK